MAGDPLVKGDPPDIENNHEAKKVKNPLSKSAAMEVKTVVTSHKDPEDVPPALRSPFKDKIIGSQSSKKRVDVYEEIEIEIFDDNVMIDKEDSIPEI